MVDSQGTGYVRRYVLEQVPGANAGPHDPGPVPPDPFPTTTTIPAGRAASVAVTRNVGYTGQTGLTATRGETSVTVALPPDMVDSLLVLLHAETGVPYEQADPTTEHRRPVVTLAELVNRVLAEHETHVDWFRRRDGYCWSCSCLTDGEDVHSDSAAARAAAAWHVADRVAERLAAGLPVEGGGRR